MDFELNLDLVTPYTLYSELQLIIALQLFQHCTIYYYTLVFSVFTSYILATDS
jgi:hypothetical protein